MLMVKSRLILWLCFMGIINTAGAVAEDTSFRSSLLQQLPNHQVVFNDSQIVSRYTFVKSSLQKVNGQWRYSQGEPLSGRVQSTTYSFDAADIHLLAPNIDAIASEHGLSYQFHCKTLACGRSYAWATEIYHNKSLHGKDTHQFYWLWQKNGDWFSVYMTQRSNRRLYLHYVQLTGTADRNDARLNNRVSQWDEQGYAVIKMSGLLLDDDVLSELKTWLSSKGARKIAVVGHNHSDKLTADEKRRRSLVAAEFILAKIPAPFTGVAYGVGALVVRKELIDQGWLDWVEVVIE